MKQDIKEKWVAALRSGQYLQGDGALKKVYKDKVTHCCLGVLCEIYAQETGNEDKWEDPIIAPPYAYTTPLFIQAADLPPIDVVKWAGLSGSDPVVEWDSDQLEYDKKITLSEANDTYSLSFNTIAELIEKSL